MKRLFTLLALLAILAGALAMPVRADDVVEIEPQTPPPSAENGEMTQDVTNLWFVEMPSAPTADGGSLATARQEKANFRAEARRVNLQYTERYAFDTLWNGLSIEVGPSQLGRLYRMTTFKTIYPVAVIPMPETSPMENPELATAIAMTGADVAQSELGYTGAGVKVAVMDTGLDYDHADLGGDGVTRSNSSVFPTARVLTGWDFVGDAYNADETSTLYDPTPVPDAYPDDCNGHGTHVSGIVGANGAVVGVAPGVTFGAYRVFGCQGSTTADIMIAAMERALADDMDVLNMSIGSAFQTWPQYPTAAASDRLVNKGMVVVASIGNSGANGLYSAGAPGVGKKVIGVASYDNSHVRLSTFTVTPAGITAGYGNAAAAPPAPTSGSLPMAKTGTPTTVDDGCNPLPAGSMNGMAVLIRRGTCTFYQKAFNAQSAGAAAVVLYNNAAGRFSPTVAGSPAITIPVVAVSDTEGVAINNAIASGPQTLNWQSTTGTFLNPTGGLISSFSSYGLNAELTLKPDLGAPGGLIRSTYPLEAGAYATISGTSMASPHVAGAVALLLEARPNTPSQAVRGILQNSADPKNWSGNPGLGFLDQVHRQGAGMLDIDDAILATTKIEPAKLSLGESEFGPAVSTLTIENNGSTDVTYDLSHVAALSTNSNTFAPGAATGFATVAYSASSVTVPAGGTATVDVTITANPGLGDRSMYGGYLVFTPQGGGQTYQVPYAGLKGDYQSIPVFRSPFPALAKLTACTPASLLRGLDCFGTGSYALQAAGTSFSLVDAFNTPYILVHLDHQVRRMRFEVFDAVSGKAWHRALDEEFVGRNSTSTSFFAYFWDGTTRNGNKTNVVPDGQYVIKVSVLKALGDPDNPAHWETWTSPMLILDRP